MIPGVDVARWQPVTLPWPAWVAAGLRVAVVQVTHGTAPGPHAAEHLAGATAAGVSCTGAYHWLTPGSPDKQVAAFLSALTAHHHFAALDVEQPGVSAADVLAWCDMFDAAGTGLPLVLYGNNALTAIVAAHPELRRYKVWYAAYPTFPNPCADAPFAAPRNVPASLAGRVAGWQYAGNNGVWLPYPGAIDRTLWYELPTGQKPMSVPIVERGPKLGIHSINPGNTLALVQRAVDAGWHWPVVKMVNDASPLIDVKRISPQTVTICRYINSNPEWESLQNVGDWSLARMQQFAADCVSYILGRTPANQLTAVDYWNIENETDPKGHYDALGLALIELVKVADAHNLRLTLPALAQGTPEWDDMQRIVNTGLFGYMKRGGHIWDCHEGCYRDQPIDLYYGNLIPGSPTVAGAGAYNFRHRYLYSLLEARNEVVPLVVSEWYGGGRYSDSPPDQLARMRWYDERARAEPYLLAFCPFTVNPDNTWADADYRDAYASDVLWQYIDAEKNKANGETTVPITNAQKQAMQAKAAALVADINAIVVDDPQKHTMGGRSNQWVIDLFHSTFGGYAELDALGGVVKLVNLGRQVAYAGPALEDTTLTKAQKDALIAAGA